MKSILLLNGPNLNLLGTREKEIYGSLTLEEIESNLLEIAKNNSINLSCFQSNAEHELVNAIQDAKKK
jgi:3-dehydroquinate dehydratase-2